MKVNALGMICPLPVIMTKKALKEIETGEVEILIDNKTAQENLEKLATEMGYSFSSSKEEENFKIIINKTLINNKKDENNNQENIVVVIDSDQMGKDETLGKVLIEGFVYALSEMEILPKTILLYNSGVLLASSNPKTVKDLKTLESLGVAVLSCGVCVNYFHVENNLQVGRVTNMYSIIETQLKASKIIKI